MASIQIQILSDLHLESPAAYDIFTITPKAPCLALLGDIGNITTHPKDKNNNIFTFLTHQLTHFQTILFVPGNHEAYHSTWPATLATLRAFEDNVRQDPSLGAFILLDRVLFRFPDTNIVILGCSLFSSVPRESQQAVSNGLNDFFHIGDGWDVDAHNEAHKRDLAWLNSQVAQLEKQDDDIKIIIFSHWSPTRDTRAIEPRYATSPITSAFSTDLSNDPCFKSPKVKLWAFGHTHYNCDFTIERQDGGAGSLRLLANQRGYYFAQAEGYDGEKTVQV